MLSFLYNYHWVYWTIFDNLRQLSKNIFDIHSNKFESPKKSNFFPPNFFWSIWNQRSHKNGRPLILKLVPNNEEWNDKPEWFSWNWQRKFILKWNVTVLKTVFYVKINQSTLTKSWDLAVPSSAEAAVGMLVWLS